MRRSLSALGLAIALGTISQSARADEPATTAAPARIIYTPTTTAVAPAPMPAPATQPPARTVTLASSPAPAEPPKREKRSVGPLVLMGVGIAGIATGLLFTAASSSADSSARALDDLGAYDRAQAQRDQSTTYTMVSIVAFGGAAAAFAGSAIWYLLDTPSSRPTTAGGSPSKPTAFGVAPIPLPSGGGAMMRATF